MFVKIFILVGIAVLAWSAVARSSGAHGAKQVITVRPHDTLWTIAQHRYGGDVRDAIWRIERCCRKGTLSRVARAGPHAC
jgi:hypothetical protein